MEITTVRQLMEALRQGKYTSVGSYPTFFLDEDGDTLSHEGVRKNVFDIARSVRDGKKLYLDINWEDYAMTCALTEKPIEPAYGMDIDELLPIVLRVGRKRFIVREHHF